jgi:hypothetical protein
MMINHVTQSERNKSPVAHIIRIRGFVSCLVLVILLMWPARFVLGQANSRAAMIEEERELKKAQLEPERASKLESDLVYIERTRIIDRAKAGLNGLRLKWGGLPSGGGFAIGPEYVRDDLLLRQMNFRLGAVASTKDYQKYDVGFRLPKLANQRLLVHFYSASLRPPR